jgi:hypothetical protein
VVLGVDQARASGWAIVHERGPLVEHGMARTHAQRRAALERAVELAGGDAKRLFVMFEEHSHMPLDRGMPWDRNKQHAGQSGGPTRSTKTPYGMGKAYGRWLECCDLLGQREAMRDEVRPQKWRSMYAIRGATTELLKLAAVEHVQRRHGIVVTHDIAEAICIAEYAAWHGLANFDGQAALAKAEARAKRQLAGQGALDLGPSNDNGARR